MNRRKYENNFVNRQIIYYKSEIKKDKRDLLKMKAKECGCSFGTPYTLLTTRKECIKCCDEHINRLKSHKEHFFMLKLFQELTFQVMTFFILGGIKEALEKQTYKDLPIKEHNCGCITEKYENRIYLTKQCKYHKANSNVHYVMLQHK